MAPIQDLGREALLDAFAAAARDKSEARDELRAELARRIAGFIFQAGRLTNAELIGHFEFAATKRRPVGHFRDQLLERMRLMQRQDPPTRAVIER